MTLSGSAQVEPDAVAVFRIPRTLSPKPAVPTVTGETGKGPTLVKLFG